VRGDSHYCAPEVLDLLRKMRCDYVLGLSRNKTLDALAEPWREQCQWCRQAQRMQEPEVALARRHLRDVKIAVRIEELKRTIKLAFPRHLPHADALALVTQRLTAQGP
jgi:hypothetical protein